MIVRYVSLYAHLVPIIRILPPSVDSASERSHAVVTFWIMSGVLTDSPVTTSSNTSSLKCLLTCVLSTSPQASTVLSLKLPLRRTMVVRVAAAEWHLTAHNEPGRR